MFADLFFLQDGFGEWNGIAVDGSGVAVGDEITLTATVVEFYSRTTLSEMADLNISGVTDLPGIINVTTGEVAASEALEGVLVRVNFATVTDDSLGYGEWEVDDGSGPCVIDDYGTYTYDPVMGDNLDIRGPVDYAYSVFKIEPRDDGDILPVGAAGDDTPPLVTGLAGNYPNPFNPETTIVFSLAEPSHSTLCVYNIRGRRVRTLVQGSLFAGEHSVVWNGCDDNGNPVSTGLYLLRLVTAEGSHTHKALLLK